MKFTRQIRMKKSLWRILRQQSWIWLFKRQMMFTKNWLPLLTEILPLSALTQWLFTGAKFSENLKMNRKPWTCFPCFQIAHIRYIPEFPFYPAEAVRYHTCSFGECTEVTFYPISREDLKSYIATGDPMDKAGAYGIQGKIRGSCKRNPRRLQ